MGRNKENAINVLASIINLAISAAISFFLSPYISKNLGVEANGYISLANSFITYAALISVALNSMGSRFIMVAFYRNDYKKANIYYSSLFFGDLILSVSFVVIGIVGIINLENLIKISPEFLFDTKILFLLLFLNFAQSVFSTVWSTAPYIKNKLYLNSLRESIGALLKGVMILVFFILLSPKMYYVGLATFLSGIFISCCGIYYKFKLLPELSIKRENFSFKAIKELISSGIWNSLSSLSNILIADFDLLITNLLIDPISMGVLAISKTMPAFVSNLNANIANVFIPSIIVDYAQNKIEDIKKTINKSTKLISVICSIPLTFLIVYGDKFYGLWQPTQDAKTLHILSIITIAGRILFTGMQPLYNVFTVTNKVRINSIIMIINGVVSFLLTIITVKYTSLGVYAIAGISVICCAVRNFVFVIPFSAKYLGLKWHTFYSTVAISVICFATLSCVGLLIKTIIPSDTWFTLIISGMVFCLIGFVTVVMIVLKKAERKYIINTIFRKDRNEK